MVRTLLLLFLAHLLASCSGSPPSVEQIDLRVSGEAPLDITLSKGGAGTYHFRYPMPNERNGQFSISSQQFAALVDQLRPFQQRAVPVTEASMNDFMFNTCPKGVPYVTHAGAIYVRWTGPELDQHYLAELGCDAERNAARNQELHRIVESVLPVPMTY